MDHDQTHDTPSEVVAKDGLVIVDGPDHVAVTFTPDAAIETSDRLLEGAVKAQGQRVQRTYKEPRPK